MMDRHSVRGFIPNHNYVSPCLFSSFFSSMGQESRLLLARDKFTNLHNLLSFKLTVISETRAMISPRSAHAFEPKIVRRDAGTNYLLTNQ